jgi:class 3 adenylate cyclase/tetratricopeptide (TPR) repeat protein
MSEDAAAASDGVGRDQAARRPPLRLFLSYRREDSAGYAGRLWDALVEAFGNEAVFMDIDTIAPGSNFVEVINENLRDCDVALVVIGPNWLTAVDERQRRRLEDPRDFVRLEVEVALSRGIHVLPVLVARARMPSAGDLSPTLEALAHRQAFELSDRRWRDDVGALIDWLQTPAPQRTTVPAPEDAAPRQERKVVTVLVAELIRLTADAPLDPEDVRPLLSPHVARLRADLERFGGTVENRVGDSVMAVFGAPTSHEDDPERAVRAALAVRDWVLEDDQLQLRIAVNTGEALVILGGGSTEGEPIASGDVITTTARLQAAAAANQILVGDVPYRASSHAITYRAAEPVAVTGKAEPMSVWEPLEARSRFGVDLAPASRSPLVGRAHELSVLTDALARVQRERSPQLVTIVGAPGIGKSRLVAELFRLIDEDPSDTVYWRQGRSLPYGDGITFWALGEMVKAQAGILETDAAEQATEKLDAAVAGIIPEPADAQWVAGHLRPVVGLSSVSEAGGERREEAFAAWRRFLEGLAEQGPLVLVFEDLHWADDSLLDFIEHLIDWASGVPMLIVCTARPELFERRPGWSGGTRHATTLSLSPLSDEETAQLIGNLSDRPVMAEAEQTLLARAGGNPLYAEQYVRMLAERGDSEELPLPETVQGIIAARLDALPAEEKSLLQMAAVIGKVFWLGAVAQASGLDRRTAELRLHALERKDFVERARRSSVADEAEYSFLHVLVRDVAYGQIPRGRRAELHRLSAEWIGSLGRTEDHAEMLAHHYLSALELRRAASQPIDLAFAATALASIREAGDRALSLNAYVSAASFYQSALELAPAGSPERAQLLFQLGRTRLIGGDVDPDLLATACTELVAAGDPETAAEAEAALAHWHWLGGDFARSAEHLSRALELVDGREPSRSKASVIRSISSSLMVSGENGEAIRLGREALAMAEQLGLDELRADALDVIGMARVDSGDTGGIGDLEQSLAIAVRANAPVAICRAQTNFYAMLSYRGQLEQAAAAADEAAETASRFGLIGQQRFLRGVRAQDAFDRGHWHQALLLAEELLAEIEAGSPHVFARDMYLVRAQIRIGRDDALGALADAERALELARLLKNPEEVFPTLALCAHIVSESGDIERASVLADEFLALLKAGTPDASIMIAVHVLAWTLGAVRRGQELIDVLPNSDVPWVRAAQAFAAGDMRRAADICGEMGAATEEARDRLWLAEALIEQNRRTEADVELQRALTFYRSVGATRYIREAEGLLAASA